jgi:tetratricopeptide (TPR) repeat protein
MFKTQFIKWNKNVFFTFFLKKKDLILKCKELIFNSKYDQALQVCSSIMKIKERGGLRSDVLLEAYSLRGLCFMHKNEYQNAFMDFNEVLKYSPQDMIHLELKGDCFIQMNKIEEGLQIYSQILYVNENVQVYQKRAQVYFQRNEMEKAKMDFEKILKKNGQHKDALVQLAQCCLHLDQLEEAKEYYKVRRE